MARNKGLSAEGRDCRRLRKGCNCGRDAAKAARRAAGGVATRSSRLKSSRGTVWEDDVMTTETLPGVVCGSQRREWPLYEASISSAESKKMTTRCGRAAVAKMRLRNFRWRA